MSKASNLAAQSALMQQSDKHRFIKSDTYIFYSYNLAGLGFLVLSICEYRWAEENRVFIVGMSHIDT
jgi:hypothetical protein